MIDYVIPVDYLPLKFLMKSDSFIFLSALMLLLWRSVLSIIIANASRNTVSVVLKQLHLLRVVINVPLGERFHQSLDLLRFSLGNRASFPH